jgi:Uma2 family endonuclease
MLEALPDDDLRHEIIDGIHYVTPSPGVAHQYVSSELHDALKAYLKTEPVGWLFYPPCDIELAEDTIVQPDLVVLPRTGNKPPRSWKEGGLPILAVEIVSPSSASRDRIVKRRRYLQAGVAEYWIADPMAKLVERWRPSEERPEILTDAVSWRPAGAGTELTIALQPIFDAISEER